MNKYENVNKYECEGVESDWLEISYTQRNYLQEEEDALNNSLPPITAKPKKKTSKLLKYAVGVLVALIIVGGMLFVDAKTGGNVFQTAKEVFTSTVLGKISQADGDKIKVELPITAQIDSIAADGTIVIKGGKVANCLLAGKVIGVTASTVTVEVDADVKMIYSNLTNVVVVVGQQLTKFDVVGKYQDTTTVNVLYNDQLVTQIVGSDSSFEWNV